MIYEYVMKLSTIQTFNFNTKIYHYWLLHSAWQRKCRYLPIINQLNYLKFMGFVYDEESKIY